MFLVAQVKPDRVRVLAGIRQVRARSLAQHVRMNRKPDVSAFAASETMLSLSR
jgi:hypothetical protein